jgi:hypothetical protein
MKRLGSFSVALPLLALGAAACGDNNAPGVPVKYTSFVMLADFEGISPLGVAQGSADLNADPRWNGSFVGGGDTSAGGTSSTIPDEFSAGQAILSPPHMNTDTMMLSTYGYHAHDNGEHTFWGTAWVANLRSNQYAVDLSSFSGLVLWAKSDGVPGTTIKIGLADVGSFPSPMDVNDINNPVAVCDAADNRPIGGLGCYDDYSAKIYPDGQWRRFDIPFASLTTGGWGLIHAFDPSKIYAIKFSMLALAKYDVWIDDIALYTR